MSAISAYAQNAGRLRYGIDGTPTATVSPLASPSNFALENDLEIDFIARDYRGNGMVLAMLLKDNAGNGVVISGVVNSTRDDHAATTIDELDFIPMDGAREELSIALDELFGDRAPEYRRQLIHIVR